MTRRSTQLPKIERGDYHAWLKEFDQGPFVYRLLARFEPLEAEHIRTILFAAHVVPRSLTRKQVKDVFPRLDTRITLMDYIIVMLSNLLKGKTRKVNEDLAALLTAAGVPKEKPDEWQPEAIKKRRARAKIRIHMGSRFLLSRLAASLLEARDVAESSASH